MDTLRTPWPCLPRLHSAAHFPLTPTPTTAQPTPTSITGPQELRPIVGKCHYFLATDGSQKFEFCAFRSVRQILLSNYRSVVTGHWKGWKTEQGADGKRRLEESPNLQSYRGIRIIHSQQFPMQVFYCPILAQSVGSM